METRIIFTALYERRRDPAARDKAELGLTARFEADSL
jgi:hypothetical protein